MEVSFARRPESTEASVGARVFRERFGSAAVTRARAATPYTAASNQYTRAGSNPPRKKPWEGLVAPCSRVAIGMLPRVRR